MVNSSTPIIVGIGQVCEREPDTDALSSPIELAATAGQRACEDAGSSGDIQDMIDVVAGVRMFSDMGGPWPASFGRAENYPRAVAARLGIDPEHASYSFGSGNAPQALVNYWCGQIHQQQARAVLLVGSEATANLRNALRSGTTLDWSDNTAGQLDDYGVGTLHIYNQVEAKHGLIQPIYLYALLENARRGRLNMTQEQYAQTMAEMFARFSQVAAENPHAMFPRTSSAEQLIARGKGNPPLAEPYTKGLVAKDGVNQAAAVVLTSVETARELGIPEEKWVYLLGQAETSDRPFTERLDMGQSDAMALAYTTALQRAGVTAQELDYFDLYSCFPIAVSSACECLGISEGDSRGLTVTGGLPFFGGPGNNYSMHAIAALVEKLRATPASLGLIGANGGWLSKHSVGIYSTRPPLKPWQQQDNTGLQAQLDERPEVEMDFSPNGSGVVETYTVTYAKGQPVTGVIIGRMTATGKRFVASTPEGDTDSLMELLSSDPIGRSCEVIATAEGNRAVFDTD
ncbi:MAG: acetyl-CoA acetyltransferase, partial [Halieaceae bacterium]|nr:acetyl-CoA acetyltransferase [Halieaceae bacterium]